MDEQNSSSKGPIEVEEILPTASLPPSVKEAAIFLKPTELNKEIERLQKELKVKDDLLRMKDEHIFQLTQHLKAAKEDIKSCHSNANNPSIALTRGHTEVQNEFEPISSISPKPMPQNEPPPADDNVVKAVSNSWAEQSAAADRLPISHMVTGSLQTVLLEPNSTMVTDNKNTAHHYTMKSEPMKGKAESKCKDSNTHELFLEIEHEYSNGHVPDFNCPELDSTLRKELTKLHALGLKGENIAVALMGPKWNQSPVLSSQNIIAMFPDNNGELPKEDKKGHVNGELLLKLIQFLIPTAKLILCHTTIDDECFQIDPMVTNNAIEWIRNNQEHWKLQHQLDGIFICIPYGGCYNACMDKVVNDVISLRIHLVCAAGCKDTGIVFPAALGPTFCCGSADGCDAADYSPHGRELDFLSQGFVKYGSCCRAAGTACAALIATAKLVILVQYIVQNVKYQWPHMAHLKELLLLSSESKTHSHVNGYGILEVYSIIRLGPDQIQTKLEHITDKRDRLMYKSVCDTNDANSGMLKSEALNAHWKNNNSSFPSLKGSGITVALIDDDFGALIPNEQQYVIRLGMDILRLKGIQQMCLKSHGLQCAMVIAFIAPEVKLLLVNEHDKMLDTIRNNRADVLALSATIYDHYDSKYSHQLNSLARNCIVLCAAGNEGRTDRHSTLSYPARCGTVITIGASNQLGVVLDISSFGRELDYMAPGRFSIADPSGAAGTSLATPAAAAQIALILEYNDQTWKGTLVRALNEKNEWEEIKISVLSRNTHQMRALLRCPQLQLCQSPEHNPDTGYGMLLINNLSTVHPASIKKVIEYFNGDTRNL